MMHQTCSLQIWRRIDDRQPIHSRVFPGRMTSTVPDRACMACGVIPPRAVFPQRVEDDQQRSHAGGQGHRLGLAWPAAHRRGSLAQITGLKRVATIAAIESTARIYARPPPTERVPRQLPQFRFSGAPPTRAALCVLVNVPSSGRFASRVVVTTGPPPGVLPKRASCSRHTGLSRIA
jgi:hypothetical protein